MHERYWIGTSGIDVYEGGGFRRRRRRGRGVRDAHFESEEEDKGTVAIEKKKSEKESDNVEDENDSDDPSKEELLRERVKKMQTESMEKKLERMEDPDMLTKEERRILTEGASVAKDLGAKLPKYFDVVSSASRGNGLSRGAEEEKVEDDDEWENALPTKKKNPKKSEAVSMSPVKKVVSGNDSLRKLEVVDASIDLLEQQQPSSPTVIPERKNVATSSSNILPTTDEKKSNAMNELRRKQSSERIHARAVAAREALRQSKSSQINDELDELYERGAVSPSSKEEKRIRRISWHRPRRVSPSKGYISTFVLFL